MSNMLQYYQLYHRLDDDDIIDTHYNVLYDKSIAIFSHSGVQLPGLLLADASFISVYLTHNDTTSSSNNNNNNNNNVKKSKKNGDTNTITANHHNNNNNNNTQNNNIYMYA